MNFAEKIFKRATVKGVADYLLYGMIPEREERDYTSRLEAADSAFETVAKHYGEDGASELLSAANELVNENASIYMELGLQAGLLLLTDLFRNLCREKGYEKSRFLSRTSSNPTSDSSKSIAGDTDAISPAMQTVLEQFIRNRMDTALEETLRKENKYQNLSQETQKKNRKLDEAMFTPEQRELLEDVLEESNANASEYGRVAYRQGLMDILELLSELLWQRRK